MQYMTTFGNLYVSISGIMHIYFEINLSKTIQFAATWYLLANNTSNNISWNNSNSGQHQTMCGWHQNNYKIVVCLINWHLNVWPMQFIHNFRNFWFEIINFIAVSWGDSGWVLCWVLHFYFVLRRDTHKIMYFWSCRKW